MSDDRPEPDAGTILRELLGEWESLVNARLNEAMATDEFSRSVNQALVASLGAQRSLGDMLERYLRLLNLPSRAEVVSFDERLRSIEGKLDLVLDRLAAISPGGRSTLGANGAPLARTRQPPTRP
jgi:SMC interacting uncharacterized protein involved in chromosome segregation